MPPELIVVGADAAEAHLAVLRRRPSLRDGYFVPLEDGGFAWCAHGRIPASRTTLEVELEIRRRAIERDSWKLDEELVQRRDSLADVLMRAVGRHVDEGRAPRSNRRVVRAASSRGDPDPEPEPPSLAPPRRAVFGWFA